MNSWLKWLAGDDHQSLDKSPQICLEGDALSPAFPNTLSVQRLVSLFIAIGLLARVIRYYLCFPLWDDESFLCVNFISRSDAELLKPLDYHQVAPILFLWIERAAVRLFGFNEYALRLFPFLCSIASLFLFRRVAERLLSGASFLFAVAIFSVSYPGIRYAAEAKPYCTDMFMSLVMLSLVVDWQKQRDYRYLGLLALMMPFILGISYPAVFAAGGLSLVVGGVLWWQSGTKREWITWCLWNLSLVVSFVVCFVLVARIQNGAESDFMGDYWKSNFPPMSKPWMVPFWLLKTHASDFLAYPLGGPNWASSLTLILCCAGLWRLTNQRRVFFLGLLLGPAGLHFIAAALQRYPYGGHVKFSHYLAPVICCLAAVGIAQFLEWRTRTGYSLKTGFAWSCGILMIVGGGAIARDLANPFKTRSDFRARAFAQSFWFGAHAGEEVTCLKSDLGLDFVPDQHHELSWSAHYLCNRAIEVSRYSLRRADLSRVSAARPLRCVFYRDARFEVDQTALENWVAKMRSQYELVAHESVPFPRFAKDDRRLVTMEYIDSYKFVPREASAKELSPLAHDAKTSPQ